eukprot:m.100957 g.100957  ORF g.100957 m.100957 type:complete len:554 (+) comp13187_c0_seq4:254-1915(+)
MAPNWLYGEMTRPESEELMMAQGQADGDFFVRPRGDDYVLVLLFKGKPTSHLMSEQGGTWLINKRKYGPASSMEELVEMLRKPVKGWPQQLLRPIVKEPPLVEEGVYSEPWIYGTMSRAEAEDHMNKHGGKNGDFFVRKRDGKSQYVLILMFRERVTQHILEMGEDKQWRINKMLFEGHADSLNAVVKHLRGVVSKWPQRLLRPIVAPVGSAAQPTPAADAADASGASAKSVQQKTPETQPPQPQKQPQTDKRQPMQAPAQLQQVETHASKPQSTQEPHVALPPYHHVESSTTDGASASPAETDDAALAYTHNCTSENLAQIKDVMMGFAVYKNVADVDGLYAVVTTPTRKYLLVGHQGAIEEFEVNQRDDGTYYLGDVQEKFCVGIRSISALVSYLGTEPAPAEWKDKPKFKLAVPSVWAERMPYVSALDAMNACESLDKGVLCKETPKICFTIQRNGGDLGLSLNLMAHPPVVRSIAPGSEAAQCGIRNNDIITKIAQLDTTQASTETITKYLADIESVRQPTMVLMVVRPYIALQSSRSSGSPPTHIEDE